MQVVPLRVLVLEGHILQQTVAVNLLKQAGCQEVFGATNSVQALDALYRTGPVDIALCDLHMDGIDGLEFLHHAARSGLVGSVIITSSFTEDVRRAAQQLVPLLGGALLGGLAKPLQFCALEVLLKKHLNEPVIKPAARQPSISASVDEVHSAIQRQQLETYFQPKINLLKGGVIGVEALTRWNHPTKGVVSPAVFMPVIESCGLLNDLFFAQLNHGLDLRRQALSQGYLLNIAFNLHPMQLSNPDLVSNIKSVLLGHGLLGSAITLEVTESGLLEVSTICLENLVRLRMMGCRLSIDDFGVGFSSLQRLCQLPFNEIKLDGEFAQRFCEEPRYRAVINSTLALGEALGVSVVIEGIEKQEQYQQLIDLGCAQGQGYLFAKPMTKQDLLVWLDTWDAHAKVI
ncbi:EAL domain-containing response regulator [Pseudomonas chlororaphis]|uniref:EAL domain-containing response regulator n=1 Tax=Pseudomonas chlororaphis TaxID=587753 RepID=UPI002407BA94|nr:EAL domain-containing response regulator [Pseudomonas chlororaphis]